MRFNHLNFGVYKETPKFTVAETGRLQSPELILENTTAVMYLKDADGHYVFVNAEYERLLDLQSTEIMGRIDAEVHPEATADDVWENDQRVLNSGEPLGVEDRITADGAERIFSHSKYLRETTPTTLMVPLGFQRPSLRATS